MTEEQINQICDRSAAGEGVEAIIESLGLPIQPTLIYLKNHARARLDEAKQQQLANR